MRNQRIRSRRRADVSNTKVSFRLTPDEVAQMDERLMKLGAWFTASQYIRALILADLKDNVIEQKDGELVAVWPVKKGHDTLADYYRSTEKNQPKPKAKKHK